MPIELITFDGDGTLWDFEGAMRHALADAAQQMVAWGLHLEGHEPCLGDLLADREAIGREYHGKGLTLERLRWLAFARSAQRAGLPDRDDRINALYERFMALRHAGVRLFEDAVPVLEALRQQRKLALITNGNTDPERLGASAHFDLVISAQTHQLWKPDPRIFWMATTSLGIPPSHVAHVGDQQERDVRGAQAAGMQAIWVNRHLAPKDAACEPDAEIRELSELEVILEQLEGAIPPQTIRGANFATALRRK